MYDRKISLATVKNGRIWNSFNEGSFETEEEAISAAEQFAKTLYATRLKIEDDGITHVAAFRYPPDSAPLGAPDKILYMFPIRRNEL